MCCNRNCITGGLCCIKTVLQYSLGQPVSQDGRLCRDTALGAARARVGTRTGAGAPRRGRVGRWGRQALGVRLGAGSASGRAGAGGRAGNRRSKARGAQAGARVGRAAGGAQARGARQAGAGLAAWAPGLVLGCALGALGLFLAQFDSVFS